MTEKQKGVANEINKSLDELVNEESSLKRQAGSKRFNNENS